MKTVQEKFNTYTEQERKEIIAIADLESCGLDRAMLIFEAMGIFNIQVVAGGTG